MSQLLKSTTALMEDLLCSQTYICNSSSRGPAAFIWPRGNLDSRIHTQKKKNLKEKPNHNFGTGIWGIQLTVPSANMQT